MTDLSIGDGMLTVMLNATTFRVDRGWGRPSAGGYGLVSQVATGEDGRIFVLQRESPVVLVMNADGEEVDRWGEGILVDPHGITAFADGRIAAVDRDAHQILVFDQYGTVVTTLGVRHQPRFHEPFNHPTAIAMAPDGELYVTDGYGNTRVHRFDREGHHLGSWGEPGRGPGQFSTPHGVIVDERNRVLVADRENDRVQLFDREGMYLGEWGGVYRPMDLAINSAGQVLVSDQVPRVTLFDLNGRIIGGCRPILNGAHGIDVAPDGSVYLAEMIPSRVTRMVPMST